MDRISHLPEEIISKILSFLPTRDVMRTMFCLKAGSLSGYWYQDLSLMTLTFYVGVLQGPLIMETFGGLWTDLCCHTQPQVKFFKVCLSDHLTMSHVMMLRFGSEPR
ncbi:BnaA03g10860D [Brassica napus]|uniref:(rape) hypothetical protein n=1 Tax=Brassica napus TaxID=3708 RepID=A0A078HEL2_BRANA|nr:unnamed protein product [Brassica napus]CDY36800.1 BnaA03g10860D [Brassica napus]